VIWRRNSPWSGRQGLPDVPEAISKQFLTTDLKKFQGQRLLASSRSVVATATRVETALLQQSTRLATTVTKLQHAIQLQSAVKQLLKLHFESQKEFDLDDRRDLLKAAGTLCALCVVCCGCVQWVLEWSNRKIACASSSSSSKLTLLYESFLYPHFE
jgi:hypothetical protein